MSDSDNITVILAGDFCPVGNVGKLLRSGRLNAKEMTGHVNSLFAANDIGVVNLECPLTENGSPIAKPSPCIRAHAETIRLLTDMGVTVVTLANNHIRDFGNKGVVDTINLCSKNGINTVGAGVSLESARKPLLFSVKRRRVAFINVAEQEFGTATLEHAGANPLNLIDLLNDLGQAREQADHIIVIIHGGLELTHVASPESIKLMRFLAEQKGVSAIIRHHSHYVQGYEVWKDVPIFYGLGNMLFDLETRMDAGWYEGLLVSLKLSERGECGFDLHPIAQCDGDFSIHVLSGERKAQALRRIEEYSSLLANDEVLARAWAEVLKPLREDYYSKLLIPSAMLRRIVRRLGLMRFVHPGGWATKYWENLLRCDTHREALMDILKQEQRDEEGIK